MVVGESGAIGVSKCDAHLNRLRPVDNAGIPNATGYPNATRILIVCGGANGERHHLCKKLLQAFGRKIGKKLVICHYPPYCRKYNLIERRLFAQVHRTIKETILTDLEQVKKLMAKTATKTGLKVKVRINNKFYPLKQPSVATEVDEKRICRNLTLPNLSYTILP